MPEKKKVVLAATLPENVSALKKVYGDFFDTRVVTRLDDAAAHLVQGVDLILCNIHFDDGALYEFLRMVKRDGARPSPPFIAIDATLVGSSPAIRQSIEIACKSLGADEVIHMAEWRDEVGDFAAMDRVRHLVTQYVGGRTEPPA